MAGAFFVDRDGTLNFEFEYIGDPAKAVLLPRTAAAIRLLNRAGVPVLVISNQAGVARGFFTTAEVERVNARIDELLKAEGARLDGWYYCPHHPDFTGACECRKPAPGMILRAAAEHGIDLALSAMAGDRPGDPETGANAGVGQLYLVRTGYGEKTVAKGATLPPGTKVVADLYDAVTDFLGKNGGGSTRGD